MGNVTSSDPSQGGLRGSISSSRFEEMVSQTGNQEEEKALEASRRLVLLRKYEYYAGIEFADFDDNRSASEKELSHKSSDEIARRKYRERKSLSFGSSQNPSPFSSSPQFQTPSPHQRQRRQRTIPSPHQRSPYSSPHQRSPYSSPHQRSSSSSPHQRQTPSSIPPPSFSPPYGSPNLGSPFSSGSPFTHASPHKGSPFATPLQLQKQQQQQQQLEQRRLNENKQETPEPKGKLQIANSNSHLDLREEGEEIGGQEPKQIFFFGDDLEVKLEEEKKQQEQKQQQKQEQQQEQKQQQEQEQKQEKEKEKEQKQKQEEEQEQKQEQQEVEQQQEEEQQKKQEPEQNQQEKPIMFLAGDKEEKQHQKPQQHQQQHHHRQQQIPENPMTLRFEELLRAKKITPKAAKSLEAFTEDVMRWILDEAEKRAVDREMVEKEGERGSHMEDSNSYSQNSQIEGDNSDDEEERFENEKQEERFAINATITSDNIQGAIQSLLSVSEDNGNQDFEKKIQESSRTFFDLLHFGDWSFVCRKHDVHVMRVCDPDFLCVRATTTIKGTPAEIFECLLDFDAAPTWDLLQQSSVVLEYLDSQTAVLHTKYVAEYCLLKEARDFVILCRWFWRPEDSSLVLIARSVEHPLGLVAPGFVRGNMISGGYLISPLKGDPNVSRVTRVLALDVVKAPEFILDTVAQVQASVMNRFKLFTEKKIPGMTSNP